MREQSTKSQRMLWIYWDDRWTIIRVSGVQVSPPLPIFQRLIQYSNLEIFVRGNTWGNSRHVSQLLWIHISDSCNWWSAPNTTGQDLVVIDPAHNNNGRARRVYEKAEFHGSNEIDPGKKIVLMTFTDASPEEWSRIKEWRRRNLALEINEPRTWYAWLNPGLYISPSKLRITWLPLKRWLLNTYVSRLKSGSVGATSWQSTKEVNRSKAKIVKKPEAGLIGLSGFPP